MKERLRTTDPLLITRVTDLLEGEGIAAFLEKRAPVY